MEVSFVDETVIVNPNLLGGKQPRGAQQPSREFSADPRRPVRLSVGWLLHEKIREKKERMEAAQMRDAIVEGYRDVLDGRVVEFKGDLRAALREARRREKPGWK
jgi:hypothetical protein